MPKSKDAQKWDLLIEANENIYVFLQKGIAERGFMKSYEIIICKIPGKNFEEKTTCKIP